MIVANRHNDMVKQSQLCAHMEIATTSSLSNRIVNFSFDCQKPEYKDARHERDVRVELSGSKLNEVDDDEEKSDSDVEANANLRCTRFTQ